MQLHNKMQQIEIFFDCNKLKIFVNTFIAYMKHFGIIIISNATFFFVNITQFHNINATN